MAAATTTSQVAILKRLWGNKINEPFFKRSKFAMMMKKDTAFGSEGRYVVVDNSPTTGGSSSYSTAIANEAPSVQKRFFVTRKKEYQTFKIENELIEASKGDKNAMVQALQHEAGKARYNYGRAMAARTWGNGGGSLGRIDGGVALASTTLELRTTGDQSRFEVGMKIAFAGDDGAGPSPGGLRASGATLEVVSIDRATGVITTDANLSTITGITVNDYIFREGDYANAMTGIPGWHPLTAPTTGDSHFGVDRSVGDGLRMYGYIHAKGSSTTYRQVMTRALATAESVGVEVTHMFVHPIDFGEIGLEVGKEAQVDETSYMVNFTALKVAGAGGDVKIVSEPDVPQGSYWGLNPDQWYMRSAGEAPMQLDSKGGGWLQRLEGEDAHRGAIGSYANFTCENPGQSVQGSW